MRDRGDRRARFALLGNGRVVDIGGGKLPEGTTHWCYAGAETWTPVPQRLAETEDKCKYERTSTS
jgi:hypothetical protein